MSDTTVDAAPETPDNDTDVQGVDAPEAPATGPDSDKDPEGADALGDPGKKALDAMKTERNASRQETKALKAELAKLKQAIEDKDKTPDEAAVDAARREAHAEAMTAANKRILRSEVKAAAAGKLSDPSDALTLLDLDQFEVGENGDVDSEEIADAIVTLLEKKPYLAAQGGAPKFDSGRGKQAPNTPSQLTRAELKSMTPQQIVQAKTEGRLNDIYGIK